MKRIIPLLVCAFAIIFNLDAQNREQLISNIEKAKAATLNEKKATNPTTWMKLGAAYYDAYSKLKGDAWLGASQTEAKLILGNQPILSTENVELGGVVYLVDRYENRNLYYNTGNGKLEMIVISKPLLEENLLDLSYAAYMKAFEVDTKGSKKKDIGEVLGRLRENYTNDALSAYTLGNLGDAAKLFEACLKTTDNPVVNIVDSVIIYYTGVAYNEKGDKAKAKKFYERCKEIGFDQEGSVYAFLAEAEKGEGNIDTAKELLNAGFTKYPSSQAILISLINLYTETNDDSQKILDLIHTAQANEPNNASLFYAEGNVYKGLGDVENALKCYAKSYETDPTYAYGIYAMGETYYDLAYEAQVKIDELDINDIAGYEKYMKEIEDNLIKSIDPFEKAFASTTATEIKIASAQALKQIYFRFRDKEPRYMEGYNKYNDFLTQNNAQ